MWSALRTFLIVTLMTLLIWLWAEAESVQTVQINARVEVLATDDLFPRVVDAGWTGTIRVRLQGPASAVDQARVALSTPMRLIPRVGAMTGTPGVQAVDLREALKEDTSLRRLTISIAEVEPPTVRVDCEELTSISLPVRVNVVGDVSVEPAGVTVRLPKSMANDLGTGAFVSCVIDEGAPMKTGKEGERSAMARVVLPSFISGRAGVSYSPEMVQVRIRGGK